MYRILSVDITQTLFVPAISPTYRNNIILYSYECEIRKLNEVSHSVCHIKLLYGHSNEIRLTLVPKRKVADELEIGL